MKFIKKLVILLFISIVTFFSVPFYTNSEATNTSTSLGITNRTIDINILEDEILCKDTLIFNINSRTNIRYSFIENAQYLKDVKININGKHDFFISNMNRNLYNGYISLDNFSLNSLNIKTNTIIIELTYILEKDYITRYNDTDAFSCFIDFNNLDYFNNLTINLSSKETLSNLTVNNKKIENNNNNYHINFKNLDVNTFHDSSYIDLLFDIDTYLNNTTNSNFLSKKELSEMEYYSYIVEKELLLGVLLTVSILLFLVSFIINRKKIILAYRKETSDLLPPIIAEAIIDGKIGLKELIMSTIIDLNIRGNIKIINNDKIELISLDNLEPYEKSILELIFERNIMTFESINHIFTKSNIATLTFTKKIINIKDLISQKLFSLDIFSKTLTKYNKLIKFFALLLSLNISFIFLDSGFEGPIIATNIIFIIFYIKKYLFTTNSQKGIIFAPNEKIPTRILLFALLLITLIIMSSISIAKYYFEFFITTLITLALNLYTVYLSKDFALTPYGKIEQTKLMELKKYINNYSLIKDRDLSSTLVWDKYLAYAVAFGIPNKITNNIYENFYNLNLNLQILQHLW